MDYYSFDKLKLLMKLLHLDDSKLNENIDTTINNLIEVPHIDGMHSITYVIEQSNDILNKILKYIASQQKVLKASNSNNNKLLKIVMESGIIYNDKLGHLIKMDVHHLLRSASIDHKILTEFDGENNKEIITCRYVNTIVSIATLLLSRFGKYEGDKRLDNDPRANGDINPEDFINSDEPPYSE